MKRYTLLILFIISFKLPSYSQTIPVGDYVEGLTRMNQLLGLTDEPLSFTQHPVKSTDDSTLQSLIASRNFVPAAKIFGSQVIVKALPFSWLSDYNSKLPYGYNNGPLYPNVGYQTLISGGVFIKAGILNIQFKPEFVYAQNKSFPTFAEVEAKGNPNLISAFFNIINGIDAPERFGTSSINRADLGQSKITLIYKNIEAGISTENMWWGPGQQNSIMMSNSAPGFLHWTFNSASPVKTIIGSFEWQLIGGVLKQSGYLPYDPGVLASEDLYQPKPKVSRYISAFTANWHPKWIDGLFLGVSGYDYLNRDSTYNQLSTFKKLVTVFSPSSDQSNNASGGDGQDFAYAINMRQVFAKYNAEFYIEYARNDRAANLTDFFLEPEHSTAYTLGGSKFFKLSENHFISVKMELTHLQNPPTFLLRPAPTWYIHAYESPEDGYTNEGRYVGAGIGPGSNSLMLDVSYINKINSFGIKLERYVHDNDLYYNAYAAGNPGNNNYESQWVDLSTTFYAHIKLKKYLISANISPVFNYNYEYLPGNTFNLHSSLSLTYFFN